MKKILFVMQSLYNGGAERSLVNLLNELPINKYQIDLLLFKKEGMFIEQLPAHIRLVEPSEELKLLFAPLRKAKHYGVLKVISTIIARIFEKKPAERAAFRWKYFYSKMIPKLEIQYDVAISYISGEVMYYVDEKVKANKKIVWIHNDYRTAGHTKKYDYPYLRRMDAIVSISKQCVEILKEEFPEFSSKLFNIPNITSSNVIRKRSDEFFPNEYEDNNTILSIGRLSYQKGFDIAIRAAAKLKETGIKFKWFVIGTGEDEKKLQKLINEYEISDCFYLVGAKKNPYPYIKNATLVVQTSRFEGKSVVIDEAKILCKTIIVTDYPTVYDQIIDGVEGFVSKFEPEKIAELIYNILNDTKKSEIVVNNLRQNNYGNSEEIEKYIQLIDSV